MPFASPDLQRLPLKRAHLLPQCPPLRRAPHVERHCFRRADLALADCPRPQCRRERHHGPQHGQQGGWERHGCTGVQRRSEAERQVGGASAHLPAGEERPCLAKAGCAHQKVAGCHGRRKEQCGRGAGCADGRPWQLYPVACLCDTRCRRLTFNARRTSTAAAAVLSVLSALIHGAAACMRGPSTHRDRCPRYMGAATPCRRHEQHKNSSLVHKGMTNNIKCVVLTHTQHRIPGAAPAGPAGSNARRALPAPTACWRAWKASA